MASSPVHDEGHEGEVEDVETDVLVELRVLDPEVAAVQEEDPVVPLPDRSRRADQGQDESQAHVDATRIGPDELLIAPHQFVVLRQDDIVAGDAVTHDEVDPQDGEEDRPEDTEEPELDRQQRREDVVEVDRREPQTVGVEPRQRAQRHQQDDDDDDETDEPPPRPVAAARRGISSQVAWDAHEGSLTSAAPPPPARPRRMWRPEVLVSRSPGREGSGSPSAPAGVRGRWGTPRTRSSRRRARCPRSPNSRSLS